MTDLVAKPRLFRLRLFVQRWRPHVPRITISTVRRHHYRDGLGCECGFTTTYVQRFWTYGGLWRSTGREKARRLHPAGKGRR